MPSKWSKEPDALGQPRFVQLSNRVDQWVRHKADVERRSMAWVIREIVTEAFVLAEADLVAADDKPPAPPLRAAK